jgi:mono/diheme cytochrome c family protein
LLIYKKDKSVIAALVKLTRDVQNVLPAIHALHVLSGLNELSFQLLQQVAAYGEPMLSAHALVLLHGYTSNDPAAMAGLANQLLSKNNLVVNLYLATTLGPWNEKAPAIFLPILSKMSQLYPGNALYQEAIVSSLKGAETNFRQVLAKTKVEQNSKILDSLLDLTIKNRQEGKMNPIYVEVRRALDSRTNGLALFRNNCAPCHGPDGDGMDLVGPPLKGSEYVSGSTSRLAMIILHGLEGPIHINGKLYNFNNTMPNFANNFDDAQIADIIKYLHNAFVTSPVKTIDTEKIKQLRNKKTGTLTEKDLLQITNEE